MGTFRKTPSINILLDLFIDSNFAISTVNLIKKVNGKLNKTTVYRVLNNLEDDGILHSFTDKKGVRWYAKCKNCTSTKHLDTHPHFQCVICGKVECVNFEMKVPEIPNKCVLLLDTFIQGKCESCIS